jgi:predicted MFS family arabinose efflux permease
LLVKEHQRGQAMTFVFLGWSVASVLGMPLGAWIGGHFGWRWSMGLIAALSMLGSFWLWMQMPAKVLPPALSTAAWRQTLTSRTIWVTLSVTMMFAAGQFVLFSYLAPYAKARFDVSPSEFSLMLLAYGSMGFVGNALLSRFIDQIGASRCILISLSFMCLCLLIAPWVTHAVGMALALCFWGLGGFSANSAQQARLAAQAPWLASASISLNTSAMYAGQAIGATVGGWTIVHLGMTALPSTGLLGLMAAIGLSLLATRYAQIHPLRRTEKPPI